MTSREFDKLVERAMDVIPPPFRRRLKNVVFVVEKEGPPGLLGLYRGRPMTVRTTSESFGMPDQITIFQREHERIARNPADLERLIAETIWHEVAHYFGMDEGRVRRAEARHRARLATRKR